MIKEGEFVQVAIVEDNNQFRQQLTDFLNRFSEEENISIAYESFHDGMAFVTPFQPKWDLIIMDIEMPLLNGMDAARKVRESDPDVPLLFITSIAQYAMEGYSVGALNYILKPLHYNRFRTEMNRVLRILASRSDDHLTIKTSEAIYRIPLQSVTFIEVYNHTLLYHTTDRDYSSTGKTSITSLESELSGKGFFRIHKSYLVHMKHIASVEKNQVILQDGTRLDIGRDRKKDLMNALMIYWGG